MLKLNKNQIIKISVVLLTTVFTACNAQYTSDIKTKFSSQQSCSQFFINNTQIAYNGKDSTQFLCNKGYAVLYSNNKYSPIYAVEKITTNSLADNVDRTEDFRADSRVEQSAQPQWFSSRYTAEQGGPYDRGHMVPAQDLSIDILMMSESFLMSNMVPQTPELNRQTWSMLESGVRKKVKKYNETAYVVSGPVFINNSPFALLNNKVWVPHYTFKVIYYANSKQSEAYMIPNTHDKLGSPYKYKTDISNIEKLTHLTLNAYKG